MAESVYCSWPDVQRVMSVAGAAYTVDDDPSVYPEILDEASSVIDEYLRPHYTPADMVGNRWVTYNCASIAAGIAFERRGNPPPKSLRLKLEKLEEKLDAIAEGRKQVPGLVRRRTSVPTLSIPRVTLGITGPRTVISRWRGTWRSPPRDYVQPRDLTEPPRDGSGLGV